MYGAFQMLRNADGGGGVIFSGKKRYEGVMFNVTLLLALRGGGWGPNFPNNSVT